MDRAHPLTRATRAPAARIPCVVRPLRNRCPCCEVGHPWWARARRVADPGRHPVMKLALYLPNFRTQITVKELEDLTELAEELDFDSVWTLDRIVVPEASDREALQYSFGMMDGLPNALPVAVDGQLAPGLPADPLARGEDVEGAHRDEHHRHAVPRARRPGRGAGHHRPPLERAAQRRRRVRLDARGVRGGQRLAHLPEAPQARARVDRDHAGRLGQRALRVPRRVRRLRAVRVRREAAPAAASADLHERAQGPAALGEAHHQVRPRRLDRHPGLAAAARGVADRHRPSSSRRSAARSARRTSRSAA